MDDTVAGLVDNLLNRFEPKAEDRRVLVGLCGIPGSGKSQLARHVVAELNGWTGKEVAIVVGMDGWHLSRAQLQEMPDPQLAKDKRGAAWTFNARAFADFVSQLRSASPKEEMKAPSFSHSIKDPVENDISITSSHRIVIFEGLYANVNEGQWANAAKLYDERWVVECNESIARARLIARHIVTGVAKDEEEARWRADNNDIPNGRYLMEHITEPCIRLKSIDDITWKGSE